MAEKWDKHLMDFIKRTGEELKRSGEELKSEAQKLLVEVKDPAKQAKVKEGLENLRTWAVATGKQAAERIEATARQVEETIQKTFDGMAPEGKASPPASEQPHPPPTSTPPPPPQSKPKPKPKSIGRKKTAGKAPAKKAAAKKTGATKSIGRKKPARPTS